MVPILPTDAGDVINSFFSLFLVLSSDSADIGGLEVILTHIGFQASPLAHVKL